VHDGRNGRAFNDDQNNPNGEAPQSGGGHDDNVPNEEALNKVVPIDVAADEAPNDGRNERRFI